MNGFNANRWGCCSHGGASTATMSSWNGLGTYFAAATVMATATATATAKSIKYMSHFAYACKMWYPLNLALESWEYLWFYCTFCIVILDYGLKLHKLLNHTLVMLQK